MIDQLAAELRAWEIALYTYKTSPIILESHSTASRLLLIAEAEQKVIKARMACWDAYRPFKPSTPEEVKIK